MRRMRRKNERGATAVVVALLLVVLVGFTSLAVDLGAVRWDQKQLQNGADAAALAIANDCAKSTANCGNPANDDQVATAKFLAEENTHGTGADSVSITFRASHPSKSVNSVEVVVGSTREHWFAPVLGITSSNEAASATAAWDGIPKSMWTLPLTISQCAFRNALLGSSKLVFLTTKGEAVGSGDAPCDPNNTPHVVPGGFQWLMPSEACEVRAVVDGQANSSTGNTAPNGCSDAHLNNMLRRGEVLVPIFSTASGTGSNAQYTIVGFAAMRITTYCLTSSVVSTSLKTSAGAKKCTGSERWIEGYFVRYVAPQDAEFGGTADFGLTTVRLSK